MKRSIFLSILISIFFISCRKEDSHKEKPFEMSFLSPAPQSEWTFGDTITIKGWVRNAYPMHGYSIYIENADDTALRYLEVNQHVHNDSFYFDHQWLDTIQQNLSLQLRIKVYMDHDGAVQSKVISVTNRSK